MNSDESVAAAISAALECLTHPEVEAKAKAAIEALEDAPEKFDTIDHWRGALAKVDESGEALADAQLAVCGTAALDEDDYAADAREAATAARNECRCAHLTQLDAALALQGAEAQCDRMQAEASRLADETAVDEPDALGAALTNRVRLERLQKQLLPSLDEWLGRVAGLRAEADALRPHAEGAPPSLEELLAQQTSLKTAKRGLRDASRKLEDVKDDGDDPTEAEVAVRVAKRYLQASERTLHGSRVRLALVASEHFPELLHQHKGLLTLGADADGEALGSLLFERHLEHYEVEERGGKPTLSAAGARHKVWKASYDGAACVLKEYELADPEEWRALSKEVRAASVPLRPLPRSKRAHG